LRTDPAGGAHTGAPVSPAARLAGRIPQPVRSLRPGGGRCLLSRTHRMYPADAPARAARLAFLARRLSRQERYGEALAMLNRAILLDPLCAALHDERGVLLSLLRREQ